MTNRKYNHLRLYVVKPLKQACHMHYRCIFDPNMQKQSYWCIGVFFATIQYTCKILIFNVKFS